MSNFGEKYSSHRFVILGLTLVTLSLYHQVQNFDFVNFDDVFFVSKNKHLENGLTWEGIKWAFSRNFLFGISNANLWSPVTFLSHMLDFQLYGNESGGAHLTNVFIHILNSILLYRLLLKVNFSLVMSGILALFFAIHPIHVESVAWVVERKGLLSTFFALLSAGAYLKYTETKKILTYAKCLLFLILGLMSKVTVAPIPFLFLLLDFWPLKRFSISSNQKSTFPLNFSKQLIFEKIPFCAASTFFCLQSIFYMRNVHNVKSISELSLWARISNSLVSYATYLVKIVYPNHLAVFYPHPGNSLSLSTIILSVILLLTLTILAIKTLKTYPAIFVGWLWFLSMLFPIIGLVQVGAQAMADRYVYFPFIGILFMVYGAKEYFRNYFSTNKKSFKVAMNVMLGMYFIFLLITTSIQITFWKNSITLFEHAIDVTSNNWLAHNNLGVVLLHQDKIKEAENHFKQTLSIKPDATMTIFNMGVVYYKKGAFEKALKYFSDALELHPTFAEVYFYRGLIQSESGNEKGALNEYMKATQMRPELTEAHYNMGHILFDGGDFDSALREYSQALELNPDSDTLYNIGLISLRKGQVQSAADCFHSALALEPDHALAKQALLSINSLPNKTSNK
jgi:tetratricopeptide (TPR) repeat protein